MDWVMGRASGSASPRHFIARTIIVRKAPREKKMMRSTTSARAVRTRVLKRFRIDAGLSGAVAATSSGSLPRNSLAGSTH